MTNKKSRRMQEAIRELFGIANASGISITAAGGSSYMVDIHCEKPKRYILPMEDTQGQFYARKKNGHWSVDVTIAGSIYPEFSGTVTQADIDSAPDWVKAIKPVEVRDE